MKIILTAGGGGHFAPLLALLQSMDEEVAFHIIGRKYAFEGDNTLSFEYRIAQKERLPFTAISTGRLQRTFTKHTLSSLLKIPGGIYHALRILQSFHPDVVVAFGGYISVPVVLASALLRIPVVLHEQTPRAGLANRIGGYFAEKICISWESSRACFPSKKVVFTGNPMLFLDTSHVDADLPKGDDPLIAIVGGSLGSHFLNTLVEQGMGGLLQKYRIIHQTGDSQTYKDYDRLNRQKESLPGTLKQKYALRKFLDPPVFLSVIKKSDIVISRAGINTVFQILRLEKPSLLIPLLHGQKGEQKENAGLLKKAGLAEILNEDTVTIDEFAKSVQRMIENKKAYRLTDDSYKQVVAEDAASQLLSVIKDVWKK